MIWTTLLTAVLADPVFLDEQLKGYNRAIRPTLAAQGCSVDGFDNVGSAPAEQVEVQLYVSALHSLSQRDMEYMVEGYFRLWWFDQRLALDSNYSETLMNGDPRACGEYANFPAREAASRIWTPDAYFDEANQEVLGNTAGGSGDMLRVWRNGSVMWSRRARLLLRCPLHFGAMPFDRQYCKVRVGLYSHTVSEVNLTWAAGAPALANIDLCAIGDKDQPCQFGEWAVKEVTQCAVVEKFVTGSFVYAIADMIFERNQTIVMDYYIMAATLFAAMSYCGFWIDLRSTPARVALGLLTVVGVSATIQSAMALIPPTTYPVWLVDFLRYSLIMNISGFFLQTLAMFGLHSHDRIRKLDKLEQEGGEDEDKILSPLAVARASRRATAAARRSTAGLPPRPEEQQQQQPTGLATSTTEVGFEVEREMTTNGDTQSNVDRRGILQRQNSSFDLDGDGAADMVWINSKGKALQRRCAVFKELDIVMRVIYPLVYITLIAFLYARRDSYALVSDRPCGEAIQLGFNWEDGLPNPGQNQAWDR